MEKSEFWELSQIKVDNKNCLDSVADLELHEVVNHLIKELPNIWKDSYQKHSQRVSNMYVIQHNSFEYIFDDQDSIASIENLPTEQIPESRIVAAFVISKLQKIKSDDGRLKGWLGPTKKIFSDKLWDKSHFVSPSIGGGVDGLELKLLQQNRHLNRGWSAQGKLFRKLERFCFDSPESTCFQRPVI